VDSVRLVEMMLRLEALGLALSRPGLAHPDREAYQYYQEQASL
jgi:hypothetical protein